MNTNKKKLFFLVFLIFIVAGILFLSAELTEITEINSQDFSYSGEGVELINDELVCGTEKCVLEIRKGDITTTIEATQGIKFDPVSGRITVAESGAEFSINGNSFKNINSGEIILDQNTGKISEAKFSTDSIGGTYNINGNKFNIPGDKEFVYPSKKGGFQLPGGTEVLEAQKNIQLETLENEIVKYQGNDITGVLNFDENGNAFVKIKEKVIIDGILIENIVPSSYGGSGKGDELMIVFDKNDLKLKDFSEYIVLDVEKNYFEYTNKKLGARTSGKQIKIDFQKGNSFYGDIFDGEKDYLGIEAKHDSSGTLSINRPSKNALPILEVKEARGISLLQDSSVLSFGEHISISQNNLKKLGTVPMRIEFKDKQIVGLIPDDPWEIPGKEASRYFLWSGKTELVKSEFGSSGVGGVGQLSSIEEERLKEWIANSEINVDTAEKIYAMAIDPGFAQSLKNSKDAGFFLEEMHHNKEIGLSEIIENTVGKNNAQEIRDLQNGLEIWSINPNEKEAVTPADFEHQIKNLESRGIDTSISFQELEKEIGTKNAQNLKSQTKKLVSSYYSYYQKTGSQVYLEKILGTNEIDSLNNCVSGGGSFGNCFDQEYKFYGLKTDLCIKSREYCPILNAGELFRVLF